MIFAHTITKVLSGEKNQTRRIVKAGQTLLQIENPFGGFKPLSVRTGNRTVYAIGKDYAVQADRGEKSVARIRITNIRREDIRNISDADVKAEGFVSQSEFWLVWQQMHDHSGIVTKNKPLYAVFNAVEGTYYHYLKSRPDELYQAWVLDFELVKEQ